MTISYLQHNEINKTKWDSLIASSINEIIYAYSWYLDIVSPNWDALIYDDYKVVMPLTWRKKWGIKYLYQPAFSQQLGIFGKEETLSQELINDFIFKITKLYKYAHIQFTDYIDVNIPYKNVHYKKRVNQVLLLNKDYDSLFNNFSSSCKRDLKRPLKENLMAKKLDVSQEFIAFLKKYFISKVEHMSSSELNILLLLINKSISLNTGELLGVFDKENNLLSAGFFLKNNKRIISLIRITSNLGRKKYATYMLVNHQLKKYAGSDILFDFEGSNIKGIAYFNSLFGSIDTSYIRLTYNNLPILIRLIKK